MKFKANELNSFGFTKVENKESYYEALSFLRSNFKAVEVDGEIEIKPKKWFWRVVWGFFRPLVKVVLLALLEKLAIRVEDLFE